MQAVLIYTLTQPKENLSVIFYAKSNHRKPSRLRLWVNWYIKLSKCYLAGTFRMKDHRRVIDNILQPLTIPHNCFTFKRLIKQVPAQYVVGLPPNTWTHSHTHRTAWVGRDLEDDVVPPDRQRYHPLHQIVQGPIQPGFEHFQ